MDERERRNLNEQKLREVKEEIKSKIKWSSKRPPVTGGQSCGMPSYPVILTSEDLSIEITVGWHRSQFRNKELAYTLFELALDDLVK